MNNYLVKSNSLNRYFAEINRFPVLSRDEEYELAKRFRLNGDISAAHKLVTSNLRFVVKIAMQYRNYGIKVKDLIQEGNVGLMKAVKRFDPEKGFRLISYAVWWIKAQIQKFILETYSLVKMGTTQAQRKLFSSISKIKRRLAKIDGQEPTDEDLATALEVDTKEVTEMKQRMAGRDNSLDAPLSDNNSTTYLDSLSSKSPSQEDIVSQKEQENKVKLLMKSFIGTLKANEREILEKRLLNDEPATLQEIGNKYKISRERVRQIEDNVKKKIKGYLLKKGFNYTPA